MRIFGATERPLFSTVEAPASAAASAWAVGQVIQHGGRFYRVSRWVELRPVPLDRGGSVRQWEVWGRRVSDRQIRREVVSAAEAILGRKQSPTE